MNLGRLREIEMIDPTPLPLWRPEVFSKIEIEPDREVAIEKAEVTRSISCCVLSLPKENRMVPCASTALNPIALRTWEGSDEPVAHAEPVDAQIPSRSRWSRIDSPSMEAKLTLDVLGVRGAPRPFILT